MLNQDPALLVLEKFLGLALVKIPVNPQAVGRWKSDKGPHDFPFLSEHLKSYGYVDLGKPKRSRRLLAKSR